MIAKEQKRKVRRIAAGEVVLMEYIGDDKPCNKSMCILLNPLKIEDGKDTGKMQMCYAIDIEKEQYLRGSIDHVKASIAPVKDKKLKAWYFELILKLNQEEKNAKE